LIGENREKTLEKQPEQHQRVAERYFQIYKISQVKEIGKKSQTTKKQYRDAREISKQLGGGD
jgi:hypothetical protein